MLLMSPTIPPDNLNVWRGGLPIANNSFIEFHSGNLDFQCFETVESNLTWIVLPDNGSVTILTAGKTDIYTVVESGNQANLRIDGAFRGLIKCLSSSNEIFSLRIVEGKSKQGFGLCANVNFCLSDDAILNFKKCEEEIDSTWNIQWNETISGSRDFQRCPMTTGSVTEGTNKRINSFSLLHFISHRCSIKTMS